VEVVGENGGGLLSIVTGWEKHILNGRWRVVYGGLGK
jgi:hypothetical protein